MSRTGPSPHLSWNELACKDGTPYPTKWRATRARRLAAVFELIRGAVGKPIIVRSAYRTKEYNLDLRRRGYKAARRSQHVEGRALDLAVPVGVTPDAFRATIRELADMHAAIGGVGFYRTFVHVDVRPRPETGRLAVWNRLAVDPDSRVA